MMKSLKLPKKKIVSIPGGLFKRFLAFFVDILIINLVIVTQFRKKLMLLVPNLSFNETYDFITTNSEVTNSIYVIFFIIALLAYAYFIIFEMRLGQTPGKMLLKLFVVTDNKKSLTFGQAAVRNVDMMVYFLFFPLILVDVIYAFFNKDRKRLLENLSKTKTIENVNI